MTDYMRLGNAWSASSAAIFAICLMLAGLSGAELCPLLDVQSDGLIVPTVLAS